MTSAETDPKEWGLGKPCAGKPPARFDEGESSAAGDRRTALSTLPFSKIWIEVLTAKRREGND